MTKQVKEEEQLQIVGLETTAEAVAEQQKNCFLKRKAELRKEEGKYNILYVDPPWEFKSEHTGGQMTSGAEWYYETMTLDKLKRMDVKSITAPDCILFMWWVAAMPQEALDLVKSWGFEIKNMNALVWDKKTKLGKPHFGMGFYTRAGSESCLVAIKKGSKASSLIDYHGVSAWVESEDPRLKAIHDLTMTLHPEEFPTRVIASAVGKHSEKPQIFRDEILRMCGYLPRLEMFARVADEGWDVFGNDKEVTAKTIHIDLKAKEE